MKRIISLAALLAMSYSVQAFAASASNPNEPAPMSINPFIDEIEPPIPPASITQQPNITIVPAVTSSALQPPLPPEPISNFDDDDLDDLTVSAIQGKRAILRSRESIYYVTHGKYVTHKGVRLRVRVEGNAVRLFRTEDGEEVYNNEVGNGIQTSRGSSNSSGSSSSSSSSTSK